jgi:hypothetical protein
VEQQLKLSTPTLLGAPETLDSFQVFRYTSDHEKYEFYNAIPTQISKSNGWRLSEAIAK